MNHYIYAIVQNGPYETNRPKGAGRSLRPEAYSGRGTYEGDITVNHLKIIYQGIRSHEALGNFPAGASEAFARMVLRLPIISGTAFISSLIALDDNDYVYDEARVSGSNVAINIPTDDGTGYREQVAFASVFVAFGNKRTTEDDERDERVSVGMKNQFLRSIDQPDLKVHLWKPKPTKSGDTTWSDGERTYYFDPSVPTLDYSSRCDDFWARRQK